MARLRQIAELGAPILRQQAEQVIDFNSKYIKSIINDMLATLAESNGVGIAAPQIYESSRIIIIASRPTSRYPNAPEMEPTVMINPSFRFQNEEKEKDWEGCLSIPGIRALIPRYQTIDVFFLNVNGEAVKQQLHHFVARIFQHEYDHLNGLVFLDRVVDNKDIYSEKEYLKLTTKF